MEHSRLAEPCARRNADDRGIPATLPPLVSRQGRGVIGRYYARPARATQPAPYVSISSGPCPRLMQLTARLPLDFVDGVPPEPCSARLTKPTLNVLWTTRDVILYGTNQVRVQPACPRVDRSEILQAVEFLEQLNRAKGHRRLSFFGIACPPPAPAVEKRLRHPEAVRTQKWVIWVSRPIPEDFFQFGLSSLPPTSLGYPLFAEPRRSNKMHP